MPKKCMKNSSAKKGMAAKVATSKRVQSSLGARADTKSAKAQTASDRQKMAKSVSDRPRLSLGRNSVASAKAEATTPSSSALWDRISTLPEA